MDQNQMNDKQVSDPNGRVKLKSRLGLGSGLALVVGGTIGSGIFVSPSGVLEMSGSIGLSLIVWLGCGVLSLLGGLCYVELGLMIPKAGGEYVYLYEGLKDLHYFWGPMPAFLFSWMGNLVMRSTSASILALTFANYAITPFYSAECKPPSLAISLVALLAVYLVAFITARSMTLANKMIGLFTFCKLIALLIVAGIGAYVFFSENDSHFVSSFSGSSSSPGNIATAFYRGLWAYDGWNTLNYLTEELSQPQRNLPRAVVLGLLIITLIYLIVNVAYFVVLSPAEILNSSAIAVTLSERYMGAAAFLIPLGVVLSVFGTLNSSILASARICFSSAREGHFLSSLGTVNVHRLLPSPATTFNALIITILIIYGDLDELIDLFGFATWMFYGLCVATLLVLRKTQPDAARPYRVPTPIPVILLMVAVYLTLISIFSNPRIGYIYVLVFAMVGVCVYRIAIYRHWSPAFIKHLNKLVQIFFESAPTQ